MAEQEAQTRVLLTADAPNGDELAIVLYDDGACGISRNGQPEPGWVWKPCQMSECTRALLELAGLATLPS